MIIPLSDATKYDFSALGGKGRQLGELISLGLNVPKGFIISTAYFNKDWDSISEEVLAMWDQMKLDKVAVRSSGNIEDSRKLSFAGLLETRLNVRKEELELAVKGVWKARDSHNVHAYLIRAGLKVEDLQVAVIVQEMIDAEFSGVAFSINPVTQNDDEIIIETVVGAGQRLVSGEETPNTYYLGKKDRVVNNSNIVEQILDQRFSDGLKSEVCDALLKIESKWGIPIDLEWCVRENKLYILQARPITTFSS